MSENLDSVKKLISVLNTGKQYPALSIVRSNPQVAAILSKLHKSRDPAIHNLREMNYGSGMTQGRMNDISASIKQRNIDADNMMQLFPDLELSAQIIISSVLSPKDMVNTSLIYRTRDSVIPHELSMKLCDALKDELESAYKIKQQLPTMLREVLFDRGSYIKAIIPESSIDDIINSNARITMEHLRPLFDDKENVVSLGILGDVDDDKPTGFNAGLEAFRSTSKRSTKPQLSSDPNNVLKLEITDNYNLLKLPDLITAQQKNKIPDIISTHSIGTEDHKSPLSAKEIEAVIFKGPQHKASTFVTIQPGENSSRRSVGRPLDMKLPPEAVIPIHVPGDEKNHRGYFILIDEEGYPVSRNSNNEYKQDLNNRLNSSTNSVTSFLLEKARNNLVSNDIASLTMDQATKIYSSLVEKDIVQRLKNGVYGSKFDISKNAEIYQMMLARALANQYTRLVYIPAELVTYFAYKYHDNGIGKSMLDDLKMLISLRAILLFAKVMALTKSSITVTHVGVTFDPNDPDPMKTAEEAVHEIIRMRQQYFPLGINTPLDLVDWVQRAGFEFSFENHPGFPQTKFDFETKNLQHTVPDTDLDELLRKQTIMALNLSPETVDSGFSAEFATTVVANNILLSKRVIQIQEATEPHITDYGQKIAKNDHNVRNKLKDILKESISTLESSLPDDEKQKFLANQNKYLNDILNIFIESLEIALPKPTVTTLENQSQSFTQYSEALDSALEAWINGDILSTTTASELNTHVDTIKGIFKAYFLRKYMSEAGYMSELSDMVSADENGKPAIDLETMMKDHIEGLARSAVSFIKSMRPMANAIDQDLNNMDVSEGSGASDTSSSDETSSGVGGDDMFGGDMDMGMDMGGEEEPTDETPIE